MDTPAFQRRERPVYASPQPPAFAPPARAEAFAELDDLVDVPEVYRAYVTEGEWLARGWMLGSGESDDHVGEFVCVFDPVEAASQTAHLQHRLPGLFVFGGDDDEYRLGVDTREDEPVVRLIDVQSTGWSDVIPQDKSLERTLLDIDAGRFTLRWED